MSSNYLPDHQGTGDLMRSQEIRRHLEDVAQQAKAYAESIAPVDTGEYKSQFRAEAGEAMIARTRRAVVNLVNDSDHAAVVESRAHVLSRVKDMVERTYG